MVLMQWVKTINDTMDRMRNDDTEEKTAATSRRGWITDKYLNNVKWAAPSDLPGKDVYAEATKEFKKKGKLKAALIFAPLPVVRSGLGMRII